MGGIDMEIRHRRYKIAVNALRALIVFVGFALIPSVFGGYEFGYYETGSFFIRLASDTGYAAGWNYSGASWTTSSCC